MSTAPDDAPRQAGASHVCSRDAPRDASRAASNGVPHVAPSGELLLRHGALHRGRRRALASAELRLPLGTSVALAGANGAGKSTLLMALAGVLAWPSRATVEDAHGPLRSIGYVPQRPAFPAWLPLRDVLALHGAPADALDPLAPPAARAALLARRAGELSAGQTQTLAASIALHRRDPLVLLDEPFAGVDLARRLALGALIAERRRQQPEVVLVLSSHVAADLHALCDWAVVLRDGRCVFAGPRCALGEPRDFVPRLAELTA